MDQTNAGKKKNVPAYIFQHSCMTIIMCGLKNNYDKKIILKNPHQKQDFNQ